MSVLLNNELNLNRMQAAASAWQFSDPHFQYYLDTASRLLYGGSASSLTPSDRRTLGHMLATVQNHHPDILGNPIADFADTHRAILEQSGRNGFKVQTYAAGATDPVASTSYGAGNLTMGATTLAMHSFAAGMRNEAGQLENLKTHGLSARMINQVLPHIIEANGLGKDAFSLHDLGKATTVETLDAAIKNMENGKANATKESTKDLREVLGAMKYLQTKGVTSIGANNENAAKIEELLKKRGYDDSTVSQTILQMSGKNNAHLAQNKASVEGVQKIYDGIAENLKDLSTLFDSESVTEIAKYAKGLGFNNIFSDNKANVAALRKEIRGIAAMAAETGRSAQEIAAERVQISTGLSAMHGGRVVESSMITSVQEAMNTASAQPGGMYTREEAGAAATRSIANTQNLYQGAIIARGIMTDLKKSGGMDAKLEAKLNKMFASMTGDVETDTAISQQMLETLRSSLGSEFVDSAITKQHYNAKHTAEFHNIQNKKQFNDNIKTHLGNMDDLSSADRKALASLAKKDFKAFGTRRDKSAEFHRLVAEGSVDEAKAMLRSEAGWTGEEADAYIQELTQKEGLAATYNTRVGQTALRAEWTLRYAGSSDYERKARSMKLNANILNKQAKFRGAANEAQLAEIMTGELTKGSLTADTVADHLIQKAAISMDASAQTPSGFVAKVKEKTKADLISLGKLNDETGKLELDKDAGEREKQRAALKSKLGIDDKKLDELLADPASLESALEASGWSIAGGKDANGGLYAYSAEQMTKEAKKLNEEMGDSFTRAVSSAGGKNAVRMEYDANGRPVMKYRLNKSGNYKTKAEMKEWLTSNEGRSALVKLADKGNPEAKSLLSKSIKNAFSVDEFKGDDGKLSKDKLGAFHDLIDKEDVTLGDLRAAAEEQWKTANFTALGSGSLNALVREGLVTTDEKGKFKYAKEFTVGNQTFGPGQAADAKAVKAAAENDDRYKAAKDFMMKTLDSKPPTADQIERALDYLANMNHAMTDLTVKVAKS